MNFRKMEWSLFLFFIMFCDLLLWNHFYFLIPQLPYLPWIILAFVLVGLLIILVDTWFVKPSEIKKEKISEEYSPYHFIYAFARILGVMTLVIGLLILAHRPRYSFSFDVSLNQMNQLTNESKQILKEIKNPIDLYCIGSEKQPETYCKDLYDFLSLYEFFSEGKIHFKVLAIEDSESVKKVAASYYESLVLIDSQGNRRELSGKITESILTQTLSSFLAPPAHIAFSVGFGEPSLKKSERSYAPLIEWVVRQNWNVMSVDLKTQNIPEDVHILVVGSNTISYTDPVIQKIKQFVERGGHVVASLHPLRNSGLKSFFHQLGLFPVDGLVVGNKGATPLGVYAQSLNPLRPPVFATSWEKNHFIGKAMKEGEMFPFESVIEFQLHDGIWEGAQLSTFELLSVGSGILVPLTEKEKQNLPLTGILDLPYPSSFDINATFPTAFLSTLSFKDKKSFVLTLGFDLGASSLNHSFPVLTQLPFISMQYMISEQNKINIPTKEYVPLKFQMEKQPQNFLAFFSFLMPSLMILMAFGFWLRRRNA